MSGETGITVRDRMEVVADRFLSTAAGTDDDAYLATYTPDATIWHSFDERDMTPQQNLRSIRWLQHQFEELSYEQVRRAFLEDGFVQQHMMRGRGPGGEISLPAMLRVYVDEGRVRRVEEYVDPTPLAAVTAAAS